MPERPAASSNAATEILISVGRRHGLVAAGAELARRLHIGRDVAGALVEFIVLGEGGGYENRFRASPMIHRARTALNRLIGADRESLEVWRVVLTILQQGCGCDPNRLRDNRYPSPPWANYQFVHDDNFKSCAEWQFAVPASSRPTTLLYSLAGDDNVNTVESLAATRAFRDALAHDGLPMRDPARLYAERHYWERLAALGLTQELFETADALPQVERDAVLDGTSVGTVVVDGIELEGAGRATSMAKQLQAHWLLALLDLGEHDAARQWLARWQWAQPTHGPGSPESLVQAVADSEIAAIREVVRRLVTGGENESAFDLFELLQGDGSRRLLSSEVLDSPVA